MSRAFTNGGFLERSTSRVDCPALSDPPQPAEARAAAREHRRDQREAPHVPACASSHSARVVKPTMIASIQYCDLTAKRFCG